MSSGLQLLKENHLERVSHSKRSFLFFLVGRSGVNFLVEDPVSFFLKGEEVKVTSSALCTLDAVKMNGNAL